MPRIQYKEIAFKPSSLAVIEHAIQIAAANAAAGYSLTLRQLYYRFVAADLIPNTQQSYSRLGSIINDARYAGLFDWSLIEDRTRNVRGGDGSMTDPAQTINEYVYSTALWKGQSTRVEVWVEKDALVDVVAGAAARSGLRTPYFSCRGYTSASELWAAAQRIEGYLDEDGVESVTILHLGDHDPSGIDMTRDITERLTTFLEGDGYAPRSQLEIQRIALNMDQVRAYNPPPNPAKMTDSRYAGYIQRFGMSSWELDALEPRVLDLLIREHIQPHIDSAIWDANLREQGKGRATLKAVRQHYGDIIKFLDGKGWLPEPLIGDG
jgi:hypothetical protein